jgi:hypothetical protein
MGTASASLLKAAGQEMQDECHRTYSRGITADQIAVTGGYNLRCKEVFHIVLENWNTSKTGLSEKVNKSFSHLLPTFDSTHDVVRLRRTNFGVCLFLCLSTPLKCNRMHTNELDPFMEFQAKIGKNNRTRSAW